MKTYFKLQYIMINRKLSDLGMHPMIGYLLLLLVFIGLSAYLFYKITFAHYAYILIALFFTSKLSDARRSDFLKNCFGNERYRKVRILENLIIILPFVLFLTYKQLFYSTAILITMTVLIALLKFKITYSITIPTPFYKKPFEFTVGFRNTFFLFFLAYGLTIVSVMVDNFNLGVFSLMFVFLTILCYYLKPENEYFVWSYNFTPVRFLIEKIKTALLFSSYLYLPTLFILSLFYFEHIVVLLIFTLLGYLYLIMVILAKYAAYPNEMGLAQAVIVGLTVTFPPMLVVVIPFFANQSIGKLKAFLR